MPLVPTIRRDRSDAEVASEIKALVDRYGLHEELEIMGQRCCTRDELDAAARYEARRRREGNSTGMIVTTGLLASMPGVFLPPAPPK